MVGGEVVSAARTVALVSQVDDNAHVTETVATGSEKRVRNDLHAYWAQRVLVQLTSYGLRSLLIRRGMR